MSKLLGRATACVGRESELTKLITLFDVCSTEQKPCIVSISGVAGSGKSRLSREFKLRLLERPDEPQIWMARGDSLRSGASLNMLASAIRDAIGVAENQPIEQARRILLDRVTASVTSTSTARIAEFLGELIGVPFAGHESVQLSAARDDPKLMHDQMLRAWRDWLVAETRQRPVVLVLDDLHWGDLPTIRFIDAARRTESPLPFMVLALTRSEMGDGFADPWSNDEVERIELGPLSKESARKLVRNVLSETISESELLKLVEQAKGNPFYLEELLREFASPGGNPGESPDTVLAMVQSRIATLPLYIGRVLRAASVFGRVFWVDGVANLIDEDIESVPDILAELVQREFIIPSSQSHLPGQTQFEFLYNSTREAAYRSLAEDDRVHGHRHAVQWLVNAGEHEPVVLAEHYRRGGELTRSIEWYVCAAEDALAANDVRTVIERAERAISCGATGEMLGTLQLLLAEAFNWDGAHEKAITCARAASSVLPTGSSAWSNSVHQLGWAACSIGEFNEIPTLADLLEAHAGSTPTPLYLACMARLAVNLAVSGHYERALELERSIDALLPVVAPTPVVLGTLAHMRGWLAAVSERLDDSCRYLLQAVEHWRVVGNERNACLDGSNVGYILTALGDYQQAEITLRAVLRAGRSMDVDSVTSLYEGCLAIVLARSGKLDEAEMCIERALAKRGAPRTTGINTIYRAQIALMRGRARQATRYSESAIRILADFASYRAMACGVAALALLACNQIEVAASSARRAMDIAQKLGRLEEGDALVRLSYAESLVAAGEHTASRSAIRRARDHLLAQANNLRDPVRRESFLGNVLEHRRILELADKWAV